MASVTFYDIATGAIRGHITGNQYEVDNNVPKGCGTIEGIFDAALFVIADGSAKPAPPPIVVPPTVDALATLLSSAAAAACATISAQVISDQCAPATPTTTPRRSSGPMRAPRRRPTLPRRCSRSRPPAAGITDPAAFAKVVTTVSLASMRLSTILGTLQGAAVAAKAKSDLSTALTAFETALGDFVASLNAAGLTITINAPAPIVIAGLAA